MGEPPANKVAIVTGAASGIGLAIAQRLAPDGLPVALSDLDGEQAEAEAAKLCAGGYSAMAARIDVADRVAVQRGVDEVRSGFGPITVLVNNAGKEGFRPFLDISADSWNELLAINLTGTFHCCQLVPPDMVEAGWGRIVNISSSSTHSGQPLMSHYVSSKSGVNGLTKCLALEFGPRGITVNAIPPGFIDTPMTRRNDAKGRLGPGGIDEAIVHAPVGRAGRRRHRCHLFLPGLRRGRLHHRPDHRRERRPQHLTVHRSGNIRPVLDARRREGVLREERACRRGGVGSVLAGGGL